VSTVALSTKPGKIPGPHGIPLFGNLFEFVHNPLRALIDGTAVYGDLVRFRLGPLSVYLLNHPDYIQRVLQDNSRNYRKGIGYAQMKPLVGQGLLVSEGEFWLHQRRMIQPSFHRERIAELVTVMQDAIDTMLTRWQSNAESGEPLDVGLEMVRLTRTIIGRVLFGINMLDEKSELVRALDLAARLADDFTIRLTRNPLALLGVLGYLPERTPGKVGRAIRELDRVLYQAIEERRRPGGSREDLLSMLLLARDDKSDERMSDKQVRDEVLTLFLAGNETAAIAMTWVWYLLAHHPEAERRLHAELEHGVAGGIPDTPGLTQLNYTRMVVLEAMRLYPPGWMIARTAIEADRMGIWQIPAASLVILSPYVTHRHPAFWKNPDVFDPMRFAEPIERPRYAYFPFGGGARQCLGDKFGLLEAQLTTARVAQKYQLNLVDHRSIEPEAMITLRPKGGMLMRLRKR
jgi:cytochrome P450